MPTLNPLHRFRDIVENIDRIAEFTKGLSRETYDGDIKTKLAVERCLQIISEAAAKLGPRAEETAPEVSWADIRGMGNQLRHGYAELNADTVWATIENDLVPLRAVCETAIKRLEDGKR